MVQSIHFWLTLLLAVPLFWVLPARFRIRFLACTSWLYLAIVDWHSLLILSVWSLLFFYCVPYITSRARWHLGVVTGLVLAVLGQLILFKYLPPLIAVFPFSQAAMSLAVPLGISYYTFKLIHYLIDSYRGNIKDRSLDQFLCFLFLFPIFTAGPIEKYGHFITHQEKEWRLASTVDGLTRICWGLIKKFVVCEFILNMNGSILDVGVLLANLNEIDVLRVWLYIVNAFLIIYMDFSAYSDIAIGTSRLFGIGIMENFNFPIIATSLKDFWRRWHMTLAGWVQTYVYMPIMALTRKPYASLFLSFLVLGLWHSAEPSRLVWGAYHASGLVICTWVKRRNRTRHGALLNLPLPRLCGFLATQSFVVLGTVFLITEREGGIYGSFRILAKLIGLSL